MQPLGADSQDGIILQFVRNSPIPAPASIIAAALVGSIGKASREFELNPHFGGLAGRSRESVVDRIKALIRDRKLRCDHAGITLVSANTNASVGIKASLSPAATAATAFTSPSAGSPATMQFSPATPFSGIKRSAAAAGLHSLPAREPIARISGPTSTPAFVVSVRAGPREPSELGRIPGAGNRLSHTHETVGIGSLHAHDTIDLMVDTADHKDAESLKPSMTAEQAAVFDLVVNEGRSIFFTGSAGTGKSFLLKEIIAGLKQKYADLGKAEAVYITAPTGIAACNIGGTTVHSFAGLGTSEMTVEELVTSIERKSTTAAKRWKSCLTLVVDEISMLDGGTFDKLEYVARRLRKNDRSFGGIQLVLAGDFCQLPPIGVSSFSRGKQQSKAPPPKPVNFCFEAKCWDSVLFAKIQLTQVFRQVNPDFVAMLNEFRVGIVSARSIALLAKAGREVDAIEARLGIKPTKICALNKDVDKINNDELRKCSGPDVRYEARDEGEDSFLENLKRNCPAQDMITLRIGAQVILLKNLDPAAGLVNGSRGVVVDFQPNPEGLWPPRIPVVAFDVDGTQTNVNVMAADWMVELGTRVVAARTQIPLKLAYALSIHKSQGMTISSLDVSLHGVFEYGQAYVALSRATAIERVKVSGFRPDVVKAHPRVITFYKSLESASNIAKNRIPPPPPKPLPAARAEALSSSTKPPVSHTPDVSITDAALADALFGDLDEFT